jgi:hypothetical protein
MDPDSIFERADVSRRPGDLLPGPSEETSWVARDPETECQGVGDFEKAARANLVYAVRAYRDAPESDVPYISSGKGRTHEMRWVDDDQPSIGERLRGLLPF